MIQKLLTGGAIVAALALGRPAEATTITFDPPSTITPGAHAIFTSGAGFVDSYKTPDPSAFPPDSDAFNTQGFVFGGYTLPLTAPDKTKPELNIMLNPALCLAMVGASCASDGSRYLIGGEPFSMFAPGISFSMTSFDATGMFDARGCPNCDPSGTLFPALFIKVMGIRGASGIVADETFALTSGFQTFVLTDPDWANVTKAIFRPVDVNGNLTDRILAVDNINVTAAPEPASLLLLGTGLALVAARLRSTRRA